MKIPPTGIPLEDVERHALVEALKMSNWVQKDAAELLSISPRVMNYKIKTLGIEFPRGRRAAPLRAGAPPPRQRRRQLGLSSQELAIVQSANSVQFSIPSSFPARGCAFL